MAESVGDKKVEGGARAEKLQWIATAKQTETTEAGRDLGRHSEADRE
jgi:hypothetical protein